MLNAKKPYLARAGQGFFYSSTYATNDRHNNSLHKEPMLRQ